MTHEREAAAAELPAWVVSAWDDDVSKMSAGPKGFTALVVPRGGQVRRVAGKGAAAMTEALAGLTTREARCWTVGAYARVRNDYWVGGYVLAAPAATGASDDEPTLDDFRCLPVKHLAAFYETASKGKSATTQPPANEANVLGTLTAPDGTTFHFPRTDPRAVLRHWRRRRAAAKGGASAGNAKGDDEEEAPAAPASESTSGGQQAMLAAQARARAWWAEHGDACRSVVPHAAVPRTVSPPLTIDATTPAPWFFPRDMGVDLRALFGLVFGARAHTSEPWPTLPLCQAVWAAAQPIGFASQALLRWVDHGGGHGNLRSDTLEAELARWLADPEARRQRKALEAELVGAIITLDALASHAPLRLFLASRALSVAALLNKRVLRYRLLPRLPDEEGGGAWRCALTDRPLAAGEAVHVWDVLWPTDAEPERVMTVLVAARASDWPVLATADAPDKPAKSTKKAPAAPAPSSPKKRKRPSAAAAAAVAPPVPAAEAPAGGAVRVWTHPALAALHLVLRTDPALPAWAALAGALRNATAAPDAALVRDYHGLLACTDTNAALAWATQDSNKRFEAFGAMVDVVDALIVPAPPAPDDTDDAALVQALFRPAPRALPAGSVFAAVPALQRFARALAHYPDRRPRPAGGLWTDALACAAFVALTSAPGEPVPAPTTSVFLV